MRRFLAVLAALCSLCLPRLLEARAQTASYPNDPFFAQQWSLHNTGQNGGKPGADIHAPEAWGLTRCSPSITIAMLDTGVDPNQEDLKDKLVPGASFVAGTSPTDDDNGHGTMTAGVAAASTDNGKGIAGVCPLGKIMPVKVANAAGHTDDAQVAAGIRWAVSHGARVLSLSLGTADIPQMQDAVAYAYNHGAVVVAASVGGGPIYPADYPHVIAVAGSDNQDRPVDMSAHVSHDLVLAPSAGILTTARGGPSQYDIFCTCVSIAVPHVSGLAALLLSLRPDLTVDQVIQAIEQGADQVPGQHGFNAVDGWGRANALRSLQIARDMPHAAPAETPGPTDTPAPIATPHVLALKARLAHRAVRRGGKQTLRVTTDPGASVNVRITYHDFTIRYYAHAASARGALRYTWKVLKIRGDASVLVDVRTDDGQERYKTLHFKIR